MMYYTHLVFGVIAGLLTMKLVNPANIYLFFAVVLLGSVFPDIDQANSTISKTFRPLSNIVNFLSNHRGTFHSIWFAALIAFLIYKSINQAYGLGFGVGYLSHLFSDGLTKAGINYMHPITTLRTQGFVETGSISEKINIGRRRVQIGS